MKTRAFLAVGLMLAGAGLMSCESTPNTGTREDRAVLHSRVQTAIADFKSEDPTIQRFFDSAEAYVVFPDVITGALVVGAAHGHGEVYQKGKLIGYADVTQGSVGAQVGGQKFGEIIFFENDSSLVEFKYGTMEFDARVTAVAASRGRAETAEYRRGVVIFTMPQGGLMAQAAVGGQKFRYTPVGD